MKPYSEDLHLSQVDMNSFQIRSRPPKSRKTGRKEYGIEYRMTYDPQSSGLRRLFLNKKRRSVWARWRRYPTEKQRNNALRTLQTKGPHKSKLPLYEYRKEPEMTVVPLHDYIIVEYDDPKDRTDGGILLPDIAKTPSTEALVVSIGPGQRASNGKMIPMPCSPGQKVLVSLSGIELENPDPDSKKKLRLVSAGDILAVKG